MKIFSFKHRSYHSVGVNTGSFTFDFNKALAGYYVCLGLDPLPVLPMIDIINRNMLTKNFLLKLKRYVVDNGVRRECGIPKNYTFEIPIKNPQKVICLGRNYTKHAEEFGSKVPDEPMFFAKLSSSLVAHNKKVVIPRFENERVDHEVELAVIIGKKGRYIPESAAYKHIAGYTILNDITAREQQIRDMRERKPWTRTKSCDTFGPIGPYIVPREYIKDPHKLDISLSVNGSVKQQSNTSHLVYSIPLLISYISKYFTLNPGDIISTGTPEGVSEVNDGDVMKAYVEEIGILRNNVVKEK